MLEVLLTAAGAVLGYVGRRVIEKSGKTEELDRKAKLLELHQRMSQSNVSVQALSDFEDELLNKTHRLRIIEDRLLPVPPKDLIEMEEGENKFQTQAEMNQHIADRFAHVERELCGEIESIQASADGKTLVMFNTSHQRWLKYREKQAELAASLYEGGSMQPMIYFAEMERLTISRIAELRDFSENHLSLFH